MKTDVTGYLWVVSIIERSSIEKADSSYDLLKM